MKFEIYSRLEEEGRLYWLREVILSPKDVLLIRGYGALYDNFERKLKHRGKDYE